MIRFVIMKAYLHAYFINTTENKYR